MKQLYKFDYENLGQPKLELRELPIVMIHAGSRSNVNQNLVIAAELNHELNQAFERLTAEAAEAIESSGLKSLFPKASPASFYIMQRSTPTAAVRAACAEGTSYIVSIETRNDANEPAHSGQTIQYHTGTGQLLAAYLQQGIASCPYVRQLPATQYTEDENHIATVAARVGVHAVKVICGYNTNYFDYQLLNNHRDSFISSLAKATYRFLINNPIKGVRK